MNDITVVLGNDENTYALMVSSFNKYGSGGYARWMLLNPLHP